MTSHWFPQCKILQEWLQLDAAVVSFFSSSSSTSMAWRIFQMTPSPYDLFHIYGIKRYGQDHLLVVLQSSAFLIHIGISSSVVHKRFWSSNYDS